MKTKRSAFVVVNPQAGGGKGRLVWALTAEELRKRLGSFDLEESTAPGHARFIAEEAAAAGYPLIIAYGGDGTIHEVVNGIIDSGGTASGSPRAPREIGRAKPDPISLPTLGIVCVGTGGDFVKTLGIPKGIAEQVRIATGSKSRRIDLGQAEYQLNGKAHRRVFINIASAGLGAEAMHLLPRSRALLGRRLAYLAATIQSYLSWTPKTTRTLLEDEAGHEGGPWPKKPLITVIANGRFFGGGMPIAPSADPSDGYFDVIAIDTIHPLKVPLAVSLLYARQLGRLSNVHTARVKKVSLASEGPVHLEFDGEPIGSLPATFEILPAALEVKVP